MNIQNRIVLMLITLLAFASCEKVINVDLKDAAPKVIIEGLITNENGLLTHTVLLSKSSNFSSNGKKNPIVGAKVMIEDASISLKDTLLETNPGEYNTQNILGIPGHTYKLTALVDGVNYTATSTMPEAVSLDSLYVQKLSFFGQDFKQIIPVFKDPLGTKNYYRFAIAVNDTIQNTFEAWDDLITDGKVNSRPLNVEDQEWFKGNDTVIVTMNCTEKDIYDFFITLPNASGGAQTPANPTSNVSGGAIGYFGAMTKQKRTFIVP